MMPIYARIRKRARQIVSRFPTPDFYKDFSGEIELARHYFEADPVITRLKSFVAANIEDDYGHGMKHSIKVALDGGALMLIEGVLKNYSEKVTRRKVCIVQCAGLLHDIKRKRKDHSIHGAIFARKLLETYPISTDEINDICNAIHNHEAFKNKHAIDHAVERLVSDCLYDADKFRWGPDNFMDTVWDMVLYYNPPLSSFLDRYPKGMDRLSKIKTTFRTKTGKKYGPQFIDIGLAIGEELLEVIKSDFAHLL
jgi:hypothetical protein